MEALRRGRRRRGKRWPLHRPASRTMPPRGWRTRSWAGPRGLEGILPSGTGTRPMPWPMSSPSGQRQRQRQRQRLRTRLRTRLRSPPSPQGAEKRPRFLSLATSSPRGPFRLGRTWRSPTMPPRGWPTRGWGVAGPGTTTTTTTTRTTATATTRTTPPSGPDTRPMRSPTSYPRGPGGRRRAGIPEGQSSGPGPCRRERTGPSWRPSGSIVPAPPPPPS